MWINTNGFLIFLMHFSNGVENAVVFYAYRDRHFAFAGDDADIHWVGNQRQVFATFFASKKPYIAKESTCSCNTAGLDAMWIVLNLYDFIGRDVDFPSKKMNVDSFLCNR